MLKAGNYLLLKASNYNNEDWKKNAGYSVKSPH